MRVGREQVISEVLRTPVGSAGVVASVPLTTVVAAVVGRSIRSGPTSRRSVLA